MKTTSFCQRLLQIVIKRRFKNVVLEQPPEPAMPFGWLPCWPPDNAAWNNIVACPCFDSQGKSLDHSADRWVVGFSCGPRACPPLPQTGKEGLNGRTEKEEEKKDKRRRHNKTD